MEANGKDLTLRGKLSEGAALETVPEPRGAAAAHLTVFILQP